MYTRSDLVPATAARSNVATLRRSALKRLRARALERRDARTSLSTQRAQALERAQTPRCGRLPTPGAESTLERARLLFTVIKLRYDRSMTKTKRSKRSNAPATQSLLDASCYTFVRDQLLDGPGMTRGTHWTRFELRSHSGCKCMTGNAAHLNFTARTLHGRPMTESAFQCASCDTHWVAE